MHVLDIYPAWTWDYVDEHMTVPRVNKIFEHRGNVPPLHLSMAKMAGIDISTPAQQAATKEEKTAQDIAQFMAMVPKREG